jgi:hypothetical protein
MDGRVQAWWLFMCAVAAVNTGAWVVSARRFRARTGADPSFAERRWHVLLSAIYVVVCGFRSALPRADVQRIVLFDTFFSSVAVGRSVATVAELCCAIQLALLMNELGRDANLPTVRTIAKVIVPLIAFAEICSWTAVLTTNYLGNTIEESSWTLMATLVAVCFFQLRPALGRVATFGLVGCILYVSFMVSVDVRMYLTRWLADEAAHRAYLGVGEGWTDLTHRWTVTWAWDEWKTEMAWMGLYFSVAVWAFIGITHFPRIATASRRASEPGRPS